MTSTKKKPNNDTWRKMLAGQWEAACRLAMRPAPRDDDEVAGRMALPKTLSRAARAALFAAMHVADENGLTSVMEIADLLDVTDANMKKALVELEQHGFARRLGRAGSALTGDGRTRLVRVAYSKIFVGGWQTCLHCPRPVVRGAEKPRYCATCMATVVRHDRQWKATAVELWARGRKGESEALIAYRINTNTGQPLFVRRSTKDDDDRGKEGIVPWMISMGMFVDPMWAEKMRARAAGEDGEG